MATKIFSGRADADKLALADALARSEYGMSFGQYCATVFLDIVSATGLPAAPADNEQKARRIAAAKSMREISMHVVNPEIAKMSDEEIKELIGSRYV